MKALCAALGLAFFATASAQVADVRPAALAFAQALAARDFGKAHGMMTAETRKLVSPEALRKEFERIIPKEFGPVGPIEVGQTLAQWPGKRPSDVGWAYVSLGGKVYSEAVIVVVALESGAPKIREAAFGRP